MRRFVILFCFLPFLSNAQGYTPFIDTTKRWILGETIAKENHPDFNTFEYEYEHILVYFDGVHIENGQTYNVLKKTCTYSGVYDEFTSEGSGGQKQCDTTDYLYIREDTVSKKIFTLSDKLQAWDTINRMFLKERKYFDPHSLENEELLIDFNLIDENLIDSLVQISDRLESKVLLIEDRTIFNEIPISTTQVRFEETLSTEFSTLSFEQGFSGSIFHPLKSHFFWEAQKSLSVETLCYSKGNLRYHYSLNGLPRYESIYTGEGPCRTYINQSIEEPKYILEDNIALNPVRNNELKFRFPVSGIISIISLGGELMNQFRVENCEMINLLNIEKGAYYLQLNFQGKYKIQKVLVY